MTAYRVPRQRPEYVEQSAVLNLYGSIGASVYVNSVYGAHPKGVTPGIPDMRVKQPDWRLEWDHETKPAGKRQSREQCVYMNECQAMGTVYVLGGVSEAIDFLAVVGIVAERDPVRFQTRRIWWEIVERWTGGGRDVLATMWYASEAFARQLERFGYKEGKR